MCGPRIELPATSVLAGWLSTRNVTLHEACRVAYEGRRRCRFIASLPRSSVFASSVCQGPVATKERIVMVPGVLAVHMCVGYMVDVVRRGKGNRSIARYSHLHPRPTITLLGGCGSQLSFLNVIVLWHSAELPHIDRTLRTPRPEAPANNKHQSIRRLLACAFACIQPRTRVQNPLHPDNRI